MYKTLKDLFYYIRYHFFEVEVVDGSTIAYKIWAFKRIISVLLKGRKRSEHFLYAEDIIVKNKAGLFFVPKHTDFVLTVSSKAEAHLSSYFKIDNGKTFLDIGANAGKWSIQIAKSNPGNKVLAFEPIPSTFEVFEKNVNLNQLSNQIDRMNIGLSVQNSTIKFLRSSEFTGLNGVYQSDSTTMPAGYELINIPVRTLDEIIDEKKINVSSIDLIKIDVEDHEFEVLNGAKETLGKLVKGTRMLIEIHPSRKKKDTLELLQTFGLTIKKKLDNENYLLAKE